MIDRVRDGEHENKMQICFVIEGFCKTGFINRLSNKYRRPEFRTFPHKQTVLVCAFEKMVSTLLLAINWSTIFNLSDMQAKQSDADENYTNQLSRANRMKRKRIANET